MLVIHSLVLLGLAASPATAFWRLPCKSPLVVERVDPIVNPGTMSGHVHTIMGGNGFDLTMDYNSTQTSTCTSCTVHGDFSNYWTPTLWFRHQNGTFESVKQVGGATVYYLQRKGSDSEQLEAFPEGFRMLAGDPFKRSAGTDFPSQAISYNCLDYKLSPGHPETGGLPSYNCPDGLRSQVFFPSCWDGTNLDSADHKSHMSYPIQAYNGGSCPSTHPVHLISIFYEIIWDTNKFADMWYGNEQPFVWSMGDATGYGFHGDFVMGWNRDLLQRAIDTCTNNSGRVEDCPQFTLYPDATAEQCSKASRFDETVSGLLDALPGCNPVTEGPEDFSPVKDCTPKSNTSSSSRSASSSSSISTIIRNTAPKVSSTSSTYTIIPTTDKASTAIRSLSTTSSIYSDSHPPPPSTSHSSSLSTSTSTTTILRAARTSAKHKLSLQPYLKSTTISTSMIISTKPLASSTVNSNQIPTDNPLTSSSSTSSSPSNPIPIEAICPATPRTVTMTQVQTSTVYAFPAQTSTPTPIPSVVAAIAANGIASRHTSSSSSLPSSTSSASSSSMSPFWPLPLPPLPSSSSSSTKRTTNRHHHATHSADSNASTTTNSPSMGLKFGTGAGAGAGTGRSYPTGYTGAHMRKRRYAPHGQSNRRETVARRRAGKATE